MKTEFNRVEKIIIEFIRITVEKAGAKGCVIGLSGGIDSAVVAALACKALGPSNVHGYFLPSSVTPSEDEAHVEELTEKLGMTFEILPLNDLLDQYKTLLKVETTSNNMAWVNLMPRVRPTLLYFKASELNSLVLGTSNKSELMIGYFTKYGDSNSDLAPIGDLYKQEVNELAKHLEIPVSIINKAPSAGLWPGQTDEAELGFSYKELDEILEELESFKTVDQVHESTGIAKETISKVVKLIRLNEHKRRPPLILKLGYRTPGQDWRVPYFT
jgi:NAD+ synthase